MLFNIVVTTILGLVITSHLRNKTDILIRADKIQFSTYPMGRYFIESREQSIDVTQLRAMTVHRDRKGQGSDGGMITTHSIRFSYAHEDSDSVSVSIGFGSELPDTMYPKFRKIDIPEFLARVIARAIHFEERDLDEMEKQVPKWHRVLDSLDSKSIFSGKKFGMTRLYVKPDIDQE